MKIGRDRPNLQRYVGAVVGGALGDALGWPHEQRASPVTAHSKLVLEPWTKRSGGRFQPHTEKLEAGAYSDDTQLVLAVARARLRGGNWWNYLARSELPFWLLYERGGGGATLRAARQLSKECLPWEGRKADVDRYFEAGGNGVAMRISPHVLIEANSNSFDAIGRAVVSDGILTHGHPRALVGALAYAYALWTALAPRNTLAYGELIQAVIEGVEIWRLPPDLSQTWPTWWEVAEKKAHFHAEWDAAVNEVVAGLKVSNAGLEDGALSNDAEILHDLGAFDKKINGSGTVAAVTSVFLISKHAAAPFEAVARAALAKGADTDTIASMTGSLAGAVSGTDWLGRRPSHLQDIGYIEKIAAELWQGEVKDRQENNFEPSLKEIRNLAGKIEAGSQYLSLPIGSSGVVRTSAHIQSSSHLARSWTISTGDGQTLFVKRLDKRSPSKHETPLFNQADIASEMRPAPSAAMMATRLMVADLESSRLVYEKGIGLRLTSGSDTHAQFGDGFALRQGHTNGSSTSTVTLFFGVSNIDVVHRNLGRIGLPHVGAVTRKSGRAAFACVDKDGYRIEIFEV